MGAQWFVRSLVSALILLPTQVPIMGFWEAPVRCDELLPPVSGGFRGGGWGGGDNIKIGLSLF